MIAGLPLVLTACASNSPAMVDPETVNSAVLSAVQSSADPSATGADCGHDRITLHEDMTITCIVGSDTSEDSYIANITQVDGSSFKVAVKRK